MKSLDFYKKHNLLSADQVFSYLIESILPGNKTWEYFINWSKVFRNVDDYKIELNILNSLCGSRNFDDELKHILLNYPEVAKVFPTLLAVRDKKINTPPREDFPDLHFVFPEFTLKQIKQLGTN